MPAAELIGQSRRAEKLEDREAFDVSYPVTQLKTWFNPHAFGHQGEYRGAKNEPELMAYFGWGGLLFGIIGLFSLRTWRTSTGRLAIVLIVIGFALAGGEFSPVFLWLHEHVWLLARFANPGRAIVLVHVGWSLLAALGAATLLARFQRVRLAQAGYVLLAAITIELLLAAWPVNPAVPLAVWREPRILPYLPVRSDAPRVLAHKTLEPVAQTDFHPEVGPLLARGVNLRQTVTPQRAGWSGLDIEFTWNGRPVSDGEIDIRVEEAGEIIRSWRLSGSDIESGTSMPVRFDPIAEASGRPYVVTLTSSYTAVQAPRVVIRTNRGHDNFNPTGELLQCRDEVCQPLSAPDWTAAADLSFWLRYGGDPAWIERELLLPLFGEAVGQQMVRAHISLQIDRIDRYLFELGSRANYDGSRLIAARDLLDRFSVGTILSAYPEHRGLAGLPGVTQIASVPAGEYFVHAYRNDQAYPRFQLAGGVRPVQDAYEARQIILRGLPRETVTIEGISVDLLPEDLGREPGQVHVIQDEATAISVDVKSPGNQLLVVRDVLHTGWKARVDGASVPIHYVDSLFRGVLVPAGNHTVELFYQPAGWQAGAVISGITWLIVILGVCVVFLNRSVQRRGMKPMRIPERSE